MKKIIALLISLTLMLALAPTTAGAADNNISGQPITVYLDNQLINFTYQPMIVNDVLYVHMYDFCAALPKYYDVSYDEVSRLATISSRGILLWLTVDSDIMVYNYVNRTMGGPLRIYSGSIYVPLSAISEPLGYYFNWDADSNAAILTSTGAFFEGSYGSNSTYAGTLYVSPSGSYGDGIVYDNFGRPELCGHFANLSISNSVLYVQNGTSITGMWFTDGNIFNGTFEFFENNFIMNGTFDFVNGDRYIGRINPEGFDGDGEYYFADGRYYIGQWINGQKSGYGEMYAPGGEYCYKGQFRNDLVNGYGILYTDEYTLSGYWMNGQYYGLSAPTCAEYGCNNILDDPLSAYCGAHRCIVPGCHAERHSSTSNYCLDHAYSH